MAAIPSRGDSGPRSNGLGQSGRDDGDGYDGGVAGAGSANLEAAWAWYHYGADCDHDRSARRRAFADARHPPPVIGRGTPRTDWTRGPRVVGTERYSRARGRYVDGDSAGGGDALTAATPR